jgi:ribosomal protein S27AE
VTDSQQDVKMIALTCPNCGAGLAVSADEERAQCDHCGSTVLIVDAGKKEARVEESEPMSPEDAAATKRMVKIILWVIGIAIVLPTLATILINVVIGLISLVFGIATIGAIK